MKNHIKKWSIRISALGLVLSGLLTCIILDPVLTYAGKTTYQNYTIIHQKTYDEALIKHIDQATELVQKSELYSPDLHINICLMMPLNIQN